jgi:competence protein ComEC
VRFPLGAAFMVDTGGVAGSSSFDIGDRVVAPVLRDSGVHRLQSLVLTHGDNDHIGGAASLVREFRPADVWEGVPVLAFRPLQTLRAVAGQSRARWTNVQAGDRTTIDGVDVIVRSPPPPDWERQHVRNEDSIVLELLWKGVSVVLTGDAGADTERVIAPLFTPAPIRIIKVPHHGSLTASTEPFLRALAPRVAVVSVGRSNNFGHPAAAVIERYKSVGAEVFRTDRDGAVTLDTDGRTVRVRGYTGRAWSSTN